MKCFIENDKKQKICIKYKQNENNKKLAFVCHGITVNKDFAPVVTIADALYDNGYNVITFDCRNCSGESFTERRCPVQSDFCEDLKTVINWAKKKGLCSNKFLLAGHSYGAATVLDYGINNPNEIEKLIFVSGTINGKTLEDSYKLNRKELYDALCNGGIDRKDEHRDCFIDLSFMKASYDYDFMLVTDKITFPFLQIMGDTNESSTYENNKKLSDKINSTDNKVVCIKNCDHNYSSEKNKVDLYKAVKDFISF